MNNSEQLVLDLRIDDHSTFDNFYRNNNAEVVTCLQDITNEQKGLFVYFWGKSGSGRSHLLQACCHAAGEHGLSSIYLPLKFVDKFSPNIFENVEKIDFVCIDDVRSIAGQPNWEKALFRAFNDLMLSAKSLIIASDVAPASLDFAVPDLKSRLANCMIFQLQSLTDEQKIEALEMRARKKGIKLPVNVSKYLLKNYSREPSKLFSLLDELDKLSFQMRHKITVQFIKEMLNI